MSKVELIHGDCFEELKKIPDGSVDCIICDLPYMETGNKWDKKFDLTKVCREFERVIKEDGAIVLTGTFRFGVQLYSIMPHLYKYDWVWVKDNGTNAPNVNLQPFRVHEQVFVFGKGRVTNGSRIAMKYRPQKTEGTPYKTHSGRMSDNWKGGLKQVTTDNVDGKRHPKTVQKFNRDKGGYHPTQKPIAMLEYLIKTYTDENDTVLDATMGSGSTMVACVNTNRNGIGIELDGNYFKIANERVRQAQNLKFTLF